MLTIFRILLGLAVVAGVGLGSFYLVRAIEDTTPEQVTVESPTATATATPLPTDTPEPTATAAARPTVAPPSPTPPIPTAPVPTPQAPGPLGQRVSGGQDLQFGRLSFHLPDAGDFYIRVGIADPGGGFVAIYHVATDSVLFLDPDDGHEIERRVNQAAAHGVFDSILISLRVASK
jgi:hypothetical protein